MVLCEAKRVQQLCEVESKVDLPIANAFEASNQDYSVRISTVHKLERFLDIQIHRTQVSLTSGRMVKGVAMRK